MGVVLGVDGGNTKTDVVAATLAGEPIAFVRGPGSNSHGPSGAEGCVAVVARLVAQARLGTPAEHGAFFLCGADVPSDIAALRTVLDAQSWVRSARVDNDTFALLYAGARGPDAVAVVCGGGINCVGKRSDGRVSHWPSLGWETGEWGGAEDVGRDALYHAARGEDGRGSKTALVEIVRDHFGLPSVLAVGEEVHYGRIPETRLGELAPLVVAAASEDAVASLIVERLVEELVLLVERAASELDLGSRGFDVVLGGGMLDAADGAVRGCLATRILERFPSVRPVVPDVPPVAGAVLAALEAVDAAPEAAERIRAAFADGFEPETLDD